MLNNITWHAAKIILHAVSPVQKIIDGKPGDTHIFINNQGITILNNDGHQKIANYLINHIQNINKGVVWADKGWKNFSHYLNPETDVGIWPWPNAKYECQYHLNKSINYWKKGSLDKSMFYLGAAVHLVQDMCVPHHARCTPLSGHIDYEKWVQRNHNKYAVNNGGIYDISNAVEGWLEVNSKLSLNYYSDVSIKKNYHTVTSVLLSQAQRSTAGFLLYFINSITKGKL
ncbi:MAG: phospholipase [Firmicutes bacterium]|nr:phospholipase [Bacillota bacterium]